MRLILRSTARRDDNAFLIFCAGVVSGAIVLGVLILLDFVTRWQR